MIRTLLNLEFFMSIVDISRIQETSDGDIEFEQELIEMFIDDAEENIKQICAADLTQTKEVKQVAHTLKGASANIGAVAVQKASFVIEKSAAAGDMTDFPSQKEELRSAFAETKSYFETYLKSL
jgi:HPt (histidine-containing phosphotransfer) domain-containing protein